jgi:hypothetical protein
MIAYQKIILFLEPIHQHSFMLEYDCDGNIPHGFSCPTQQLLGVAFTCPVNESAGWRQRFVEKPRYRCSGSGQGHIDAMSCHKNQQVMRALGANWRICSCVSASQNPNFCYVWAHSSRPPGGAAAPDQASQGDAKVSRQVAALSSRFCRDKGVKFNKAAEAAATQKASE